MSFIGDVIVAWILWTSCCTAGQIDPSNENDGSSPQGCWLNVSLEADEAITRADRLAETREWAEAARAFQSIIDQFGDSLVGRGDGRFISVADSVARRIGSGPAPCLAAYREFYESAAQAALDAARGSRSAAELERLADRYFPTSAAADAVDLAAQIALEAGDFAAAARAYDRLLASHPDRKRQAVFWRAKRSVAALWNGDPTEIEAVIRDLSRSDHGPTVNWGGASRSLESFLKSVRDDAMGGAPPAAGPTPRSTAVGCDGAATQFAGAIRRHGCFASTAGTEARLWRFVNPQPADADDDSTADPMDFIFPDGRGAPRDRILSSGRLLAQVPVTDGELIFLHDATRVWAVDPDRPDAVRWRYQLPAAEAAPASDEGSPAMYTSLIDDGRLYVHLQTAGSAKNARPSDGGTRGASLVCLEPRTGRLLWRNDLTEFATPFEDTILDGAPLMYHGVLCAVARRSKSFGFEACFLLRFHPADGRLLSATHLGEAATGAYGYHRATLTHPAAGGASVFICSNLGSVAAVSVHTGRVRWIRRYEATLTADQDTFWPDRIGYPIRAWHYHPVLLWRDAVVALPLDADYLLILKQSDGEQIARIPLESLMRPQTILGILGDRLYAVGDAVVCYDLAAQRIVWQRPLATGQLFGRGALAAGGVLIPTTDALLRYPLDGGPAQRLDWPLNEAGNVIPFSDQIVVAAPDRLYGLVDRAEAFKRLERRVADRPDDPLAPLALAELAYETGEYPRGLAAVDDCLTKLEKTDRPGANAAKRRLLNSLTAIALSLLPNDATAPRDGGGDRTPDGGARETARLKAAVELLRRGAEIADDDADQVRMRLLLGRAHLLAGDPAAGVAAYQKIVSDRRLRGASLLVSDRLRPPSFCVASVDSCRAVLLAGNQPIGATVVDWIDALVQRYGDEVYGPIEREAAARLKRAQPNPDDAVLIEITRSYPNSHAAAEAFAALADRCRGRGDLAEAIAYLRRALTAPRRSDRHARIVELAELLRQAGRHADAAFALDRAARDHPDSQAVANGRPVTFADLRRQWYGDEAFIEPFRRIADVDASAEVHAYKRLFPDRVTILDPVFPDLPDTAWDSMICYSGKRLEARAAATGRAVWPDAFDCESEPTLLGSSGGHLVFSTPGTIFALTRTSGRLSWRYGNPSPADPMVEPESMPAWVVVAMTARIIVAANDRGEIVCLDAAGGGLRWSQSIEAAGLNHFAADDRLVAYAAWKEKQAFIAVRDAATGRLTSRYDLNDGALVQRLLLVPGRTPPAPGGRAPRTPVTDFDALAPSTASSLLAVGSTQLLSIDPSTATLNWQVETAEPIALATVQVDGDGVLFATERRRIGCIRPADGSIAWCADPFDGLRGRAIWLRRAGPCLLAASGNHVVALDAADGRTLWRMRSPDCLRSQAPIITTEHVVTVGRLEKDSTRKNGDDKGTADGTKRFRIRRFRLADGVEDPPPDAAPDRPSAATERAAGHNDAGAESKSPWVTDPLKSFGGLFVRDGAILILDGPLLIGHAAGR